MNDGRFSVAVILNEPEHVLRRFVRWYRHLGASHIYIYFDDPNDLCAHIFADSRDVTITLCDDEFLLELGVSRSERFTLRQNAVYSHCYRRAETPWITFVDGDEYIYFCHRTAGEFLGRQPETVGSITVATAELLPNMVKEPDFLFRMPLDRPTTKRVYAENMRMFRKRFGLVGHADGKSIVRTGLAVRSFRQHWTLFEDESIQRITVDRKNSIYLLHFICESFESWQRKVDWRRGSSGFPNHVRFAVEAALETGDETALRDVYQRLHEPVPDVLKRLDKAGGVLQLTIPELAKDIM